MGQFWNFMNIFGITMRNGKLIRKISQIEKANGLTFLLSKTNGSVLSA